MSKPTLPPALRKAVQLLDHLDDRLGTRPLFATLLSPRRLPVSDRAIVTVHTLRTFIALHSGLLGWLVREVAGQMIYGSLRSGRPGLRGLRPVEGADGRGWHRAFTLAAVHRCRITLGRLRGRSGRASVTLFCGYHPRSGELPVYVLLRYGRIEEMAFATDDGGISPGIGVFPPSPQENREALSWLSAHLAGGEPNEESVRLFLDRG